MREIDEKVVELEFDNDQFEKGIAQSLLSLKRLKEGLKFKGIENGFNTISASVKNVKMDALANSCDVVTSKFSYMQMTIQHQINKIVDTAISGGKKLIDSFTIDPVKSGFQEYETQIGAIQTILANTSHNGTTLSEVNNALDELNHYADKTIYNFTQMTRNIGTFTAAGVDLETSTQSIKGIANLAAVSGSTAQQASTAMYQLSQALAAGKVRLADWNSVVNAGMGGKVFQDALVRTSELLGTGAQEMIDYYGSFRDSLTEGEWLTTEVLTETLRQFAGSYSEADLIAQGFNEDQAKSIAEMAQTAEDAATKVKTLTQLMDTLREATQSGWTETFELIVGNFDQSKELYTSISDTIGGFITNFNKTRNEFLGESLQSNWDKLYDAMTDAKIPLDEFEYLLQENLANQGYNVEELIKEYGRLEHVMRSGAVDGSVLENTLAQILGDASRIVSLTEELNIGDRGEEVARVQQILKDLGYELGSFGVDGIYGSQTEAAVKALQEASGIEITGLVDEATLKILSQYVQQTDQLITLNEDLVKGAKGEQVRTIQQALQDAGYDFSTFGIDGQFGAETEAAIKAFQKANQMEITGVVDQAFVDALFQTAEYSQETKDNIYGLSKEIMEMGGREKIILALSTLFGKCATALGAVKDEFLSVFNPMTNAQLDGMINRFLAWSQNLTISDKTANNILDTLHGLFAAADLVVTVMGGGFRLAFDIATRVLSACGVSILDVTGAIGRLISNIHHFIKYNQIVETVVSLLAMGLTTAVSAVKDWYKSISDNTVINRFRDMVDSVYTSFQKLGNLEINSKAFRDQLLVMYEAVTSFFRNLPLYFRQGFQDALTRISNATGISFDSIHILGDMFDSIRNAFTSGFNLEDKSFAEMAEHIKMKVVDSLNTMVRTIPDALNEDIESFYEALPESFRAGFDNAIKKFNKISLKSVKSINVFGNFFKSIKSAFTTGFKLEDASFTQIATHIKNQIVAAFTALVTELPAAIDADIQTLFNKIRDKFGIDIPGLYESMKEKGRNIVEGLRDGVGEYIEVGASKVAELATACIERFCALFGINSPSKVAHEWGVNIGEGFINGLKAIINSVMTTITSFGNSVKEGFTKFVNVLAEFPVKMKQWTSNLTSIIDQFKSGDLTIGSLLDGFFKTDVFSKIDAKASGFLGTAKEYLLGIYESVKSFALNIDWGKIMVIAMAGLQGFLEVKKYKLMLRGVDSMVKMFGGVGESFIMIGRMFRKVGDVIGNLADVFTAFEKTILRVGNSIAFENRMQGLKQFALAVAIMTGCIIAVAMIPPTYLKQAAIVIGSITAILAALMFVMSKLDSVDVSFNRSTGFKMTGLKSTIIQLGIALGVIGGLVYLFKDVETDTLTRGFLAVGAMAGALLVCVAAMAGVSTVLGSNRKSLKSLADFMFDFSKSLAVISLCLYLMKGLSDKDIERGIVFIGSLSLFIAVIAGITGVSNAGKNIDKLGDSMLKLSVALGIMVGVCKLANQLSPEDAKKGAVFGAAMLGFITVLTRLVGVRKLKNLGKNLTYISLAMGVIAFVATKCGDIPWENFGKVGALAAGMLAFVGILVKITEIDEDGKLADVGKTVLTLSLGIAALGFIASLLGKVPAEQMWKGIGAVSALGVIVAGLIAVTSLIKTSAALGPLIALMAGITLLIGTITALAYFIKDESVYTRLGSLVEEICKLMLSMGAMLGMMSLINPASAMKAVGVFAIVELLFAGLGALCVYAAKQVTTEEITRMTTMCDALLEAMFKLGALSAGFTALSVLAKFAGLKGIGLGLVAVIAVVGVAAALAAAISAGAMKLGKMDDKRIEQLNKGFGVLKDVMKGLGEMIGTFVGSIKGSFTENALSGFGQICTELNEGLTSLDGINTDKLDNIKNLGVVIKEVSTAGLATALNDNTLGEGGDSIRTFMTSVSTIVTELGTMAKKLEEQDIDLTSIEAIADIATKFGEIESLLVPAGQKFDSLGNASSTFKIEGFGTSISAFMTALTTTSDAINNGIKGKDGKVKKLDSTALTNLAGIGTTFNTLEQAIEPTASFVQKIFGVESFKDIGDFGSRIENYVTALVSASSTLSNGFLKGDGTTATYNPDAFGSAIAMAELFTTLEKGIVPTKSLLQKLIGEEGYKDIGDFGSRIENYVTALVAASSALQTHLTGEDSNVGEFNTSAFDTLISIGTKFTSLEAIIEPTASLLTKIKGEDGYKDIGDFGDRIKNFATALGTAAGALSNIQDSNKRNVSLNPAKFKTAAECGKALVTLEKNLPSSSLFTMIAGNYQSIGNFGTQLKQYIEGLAEASSAIVDCTMTEEDAEKAKNIGVIITELQKALPEDGMFSSTGDLGQFGTDMAEVGKGLKSISDVAKDVPLLKLTALVGITDKIIERMASDAAVVNSTYIDGLLDFGESITAWWDEIKEINTETFSALLTELDRMIDLAIEITEKYTEISVPDDLDLGFGVLGEQLAEFKKAYGTVNAETMTSMVSAVTNLKDVLISLKEVDTSALSNFNLTILGTQIELFGNDIAQFNPSHANKVVSVMERIKTFISGLTTLDTSGVSTFSAAVTQLGQTSFADSSKALQESTGDFAKVGSSMVDSLASGASKNTGLTDSTVKMMQSTVNAASSYGTSFQMVGRSLIVHLVTGFQSVDLTGTVNGQINSILANISGYYGNFSIMGTYVMNGFCVGMSNQSSAVYNTAYALGRQAINALKAATSVASPSREAMKIGNFFGMGAAIGITDTMRMVDKSATALGKQAVSSLQSTMGDFASYSEDTLTITPVLDLSNIRSGAGEMYGLLSNGISVSPNANLAAVQSYRNVGGRGSSNGDIVDAINTLRKDIGNLGGTTNMINGINYSQNEDVGTAIDMLLNATIRERRS